MSFRCEKNERLMWPNSAIDSDTYSAPLLAPNSAPHREPLAHSAQGCMPTTASNDAAEAFRRTFNLPACEVGWT
jgi:hypothetical protein